jgi:hypothetical protein
MEENALNLNIDIVFKETKSFGKLEMENTFYKWDGALNQLLNKVILI